MRHMTLDQSNRQVINDLISTHQSRSTETSAAIAMSIASRLSVPSAGSTNIRDHYRNMVEPATIQQVEWFLDLMPINTPQVREMVEAIYLWRVKIVNGDLHYPTKPGKDSNIPPIAAVLGCTGVLGQDLIDALNKDTSITLMRNVSSVLQEYITRSEANG